MSGTSDHTADVRCAKCDAPRYTGEERCHYCGGGDPIDTAPLMIGILTSVLLTVLALGIIVRN